MTDEVCVKDGHGAQVVAVKVSGRDDTLVAKIYDPLYYPDPTKPPQHDDSTSVDFDSVPLADYHYCNEAMMYQSINDALGGKLVPEYHGAFTMDVASNYRTRAVRLILMERVRGASMLELQSEVESASLEQRQLLLSKIIDAESMLYYHNIIHTDFHPRNIMLSGKLGRPGFRLRIVDFGEAQLSDKNGMFEEITKSKYGPISPILRWQRRFLLDTRRTDWIDWNYLQWLREHWKDSGHYAPITEDMRIFWIGTLDEWRVLYNRRFKKPQLEHSQGLYK